MAGLNCGVTLTLLGILVLGATLPRGGAEALNISLPHGSGITVLIKPGPFTVPGKPCYLITSRKYVTTLSIKSGERKDFTFTCPNPQNHFVIEIQKNIGKYTPWTVGSQPLRLGR